MPRITADHLLALCAPPMANGVRRTLLVWSDSGAVITTPDAFLASGSGRMICSRSDLLDAGLLARIDGSLGGPATAVASRLARLLDSDLDRALSDCS